MDTQKYLYRCYGGAEVKLETYLPAHLKAEFPSPVCAKFNPFPKESARRQRKVPEEDGGWPHVIFFDFPFFFCLIFFDPCSIPFSLI